MKKIKNNLKNFEVKDEERTEWLLYSRQDYKEWGKEGGRPRKFWNVAEKLRFYRQQRKLQATGQPLRQYRSYERKVITGTGELSGKGRLATNFINCPVCKINMAKKGALLVKENEYGELVDYCGKCGYSPTAIKIRWGAGTQKERDERKKELAEKEIT